tara:strand:- start:2270 stop:2470 length:201 start_codon:yes stop_codon:yes gene_type:complete
MKEFKEYKFLIISIFIFTVFLMLWTDYNTKQTAKKIKESRIEIEEKLRLAKEKIQQGDSILIEKKK